jgi:hypothetical protein
LPKIGTSKKNTPTRKNSISKAEKLGISAFAGSRESRGDETDPRRRESRHGMSLLS